MGCSIAAVSAGVCDGTVSRVLGKKEEEKRGRYNATAKKVDELVAKHSIIISHIDINK